MDGKKMVLCDKCRIDGYATGQPGSTDSCLHLDGPEPVVWRVNIRPGVFSLMATKGMSDPHMLFSTHAPNLEMIHEGLNTPSSDKSRFTKHFLPDEVNDWLKSVVEEALPRGE